MQFACQDCGKAKAQTKAGPVGCENPVCPARLELCHVCGEVKKWIDHCKSDPCKAAAKAKYAGMVPGGPLTPCSICGGVGSTETKWCQIAKAGAPTPEMQTVPCGQCVPCMTLGAAVVDCSYPVLTKSPVGCTCGVCKTWPDTAVGCECLTCKTMLCDKAKSTSHALPFQVLKHAMDATKFKAGVKAASKKAFAGKHQAAILEAFSNPAEHEDPCPCEECVDLAAAESPPSGFNLDDIEPGFDLGSEPSIGAGIVGHLHDAGLLSPDEAGVFIKKLIAKPILFQDFIDVPMKTNINKVQFSKKILLTSKHIVADVNLPFAGTPDAHMGGSGEMDLDQIAAAGNLGLVDFKTQKFDMDIFTGTAKQDDKPTVTKPPGAAVAVGSGMVYHGDVYGLHVPALLSNVLKSKYPGNCWVCKEWFPALMPIVWQPSNGAGHLGCCANTLVVKYAKKAGGMAINCQKTALDAERVTLDLLRYYEYAGKEAIGTCEDSNGTAAANHQWGCEHQWAPWNQLKTGDET